MKPWNILSRSLSLSPFWATYFDKFFHPLLIMLQHSSGLSPFLGSLPFSVLVPRLSVLLQHPEHFSWALILFMREWNKGFEQKTLNFLQGPKNVLRSGQERLGWGLVLRVPGFPYHLISLLATWLNDFLSRVSPLPLSPRLQGPGVKGRKSLTTWMKEYPKTSASLWALLLQKDSINSEAYC